jgi:hypothetical protein
MWATKFHTYSKKRQYYSSVYVNLQIFRQQTGRLNILLPMNLRNFRHEISYEQSLLQANVHTNSPSYRPTFIRTVPLTGQRSYVRVTMKLSLKTRSSEVWVDRGKGQKFDATSFGYMVARSDLGTRNKTKGVVTVVRLLPEGTLTLPHVL